MVFENWVKQLVLEGRHPAAVGDLEEVRQVFLLQKEVSMVLLFAID